MKKIIKNAKIVTAKSVLCDSVCVIKDGLVDYIGSDID